MQNQIKDRTTLPTQPDHCDTRTLRCKRWTHLWFWLGIGFLRALVFVPEGSDQTQLLQHVFPGSVLSAHSRVNEHRKHQSCNPGSNVLFGAPCCGGGHNTAKRRVTWSWALQLNICTIYTISNFISEPGMPLDCRCCRSLNKKLFMQMLKYKIK